jgi:hypothetical protein
MTYLNKYKSLIPFICLLLFHIIFLFFFPVFSEVTWYEFAGFISLLNTLNFILYINWNINSVYFRLHWFFPFKVSPTHLILCECRDYFLRFDVLAITAFTVVNVYLKLNMALEPFVICTQIFFSLIGGTLSLILFYKISKEVFLVLNPYIYYLKQFIFLLITLTFQKLAVIHPFGGCFFLVSIYSKNSYLILSYCLIVLLICVSLLDFGWKTVVFYKRRWSTI